MSRGAARQSADTAAGSQIGANQGFVFLEGVLWMVVGDVNAAHGLPPHVPGPDAMVGHSAFVHINGIPVCREGDAAGCGHPTSGSSVTYCND